MNLIINLAHINEKKLFEKYQLKFGETSILESIYLQVSEDVTTKTVILAHNKFADQIEEMIDESKILKNTFVKRLNTKTEIKIAEMLLLENISSTSKVFQFDKMEIFFADKLNVADNTIIIDGSKLYKNANFNFSNTTETTAIKFIDKTENININFMLYIPANYTNTKAEIREVIIRDYAQNFINFNNLKSLINSNSYFAENRQLRHEYIDELISNFEFEQLTNTVKKYAENDKYWAMFYIEILEANGNYIELKKFILNNKINLSASKFSISQRTLYKRNLALVNHVLIGETLYLPVVDEYLQNDNIELEYVLNVLSKSNLKNINISALLNKLINTKKLNEKQAVTLLNEFEEYYIMPCIKKKVIITVIDYFMLSHRFLELSQNSVTYFMSLLHEDEHLFSPGIKKRISMYKKELGIALKEEVDVSKENEIKTEKGKVAICITGLAKQNFQLNLETIKYFTSQLNADYFVQMWNVSEEIPPLASPEDGNAFKWADYYMKRLNKSLPSFLERKRNFQALLPETSKLLFTGEYKSLTKDVYREILGDKLIDIKKYDYNNFKEKLQNQENIGLSIGNTLLKSFERYQGQKMVDSAIKKNNIKYEYVINIDISVVLKKMVKLDEFTQIGEREFYVLFEENSNINDLFTIAHYDTAKTINDFWKICLNSNDWSPYTTKGVSILDAHQNPIIYHYLYNDLLYKDTNDNFGSPFVARKLKLPKTSDTVKNDLIDFDGDPDQIINYFNLVDESFSGEIKKSYNFKNIDDVSLLHYAITDEGVSFEVSLKGKKLKNIGQNRFYFTGTSQPNMDALSSKVLLYKQNADILKYEDEEIVLKIEILNNDLFRCKNMKLSLMLHEHTVRIFEINCEGYEDSYEVQKNGLKYVSFDNQIETGIKTKSYYLDRDFA